MLNFISEFISEFLIRNSVITDKEKDMYKYCISGFLEMSFNVIVTLVIGALVNKFVETVIFLCVIIPLRRLSGGYHAEKSSTCFILSIFIYILTINVSDMVSINIYFVVIFFMLISVLIGILTPVDSIHKRINKDERRKLKNRYCLFAICLTLLFSILMFCNYKNYCILIIVIQFFTLITQITGIVKNKFTY